MQDTVFKATQKLDGMYDYKNLGLGTLRFSMDWGTQTFDIYLDDSGVSIPFGLFHTTNNPEDFIVAYVKELINKEITKMKKESNDQMLQMAKNAVARWFNKHNGPTTIQPDEVYIVWFCKTLQNWKALCGAHHEDGMYYEVTYDGNKNCAYLDAYKKWDNEQIYEEDLV